MVSSSYKFIGNKSRKIPSSVDESQYDIDFHQDDPKGGQYPALVTLCGPKIQYHS